MFDYDPSIGSGFRLKSGLEIGMDQYGRPFYINYNSLSGHLSITGKTGTGKSSYLVYLLKNLDKERANVVVIDPHGTLKDAVYNTKKKVIYLGLDRVEKNGASYQMKMNVLDRRFDANMLGGWIRSIFSSKAVSNNTWGPRLEVMFRSVLAEYIKSQDNPTLSEFFRIVSDVTSMRMFIGEIENDAVRSLIKSFISDRSYWREYSASTLNKILPLISDESVNDLVSSSKNSLDLYTEMATADRFVFVDVAKGKMPSEVSTQIAFLFLMKIWFDALVRYNRSGPVKTYVVVDEAQNVPPDILETILSEGRKYGISLILSNQYISQMEGYSSAVYGNVRNFISFLVSHEDAAYLSRTVGNHPVSRKLERILTTQSLHKLVAWSTDGSYGPVSLGFNVVPIAKDERIEESIVEFGSKGTERKTESEESDHSKLISAFAKYLDGHGIQVNFGHAGKYIPDSFFYYGDRLFIVEAENSDIDHKERILDKLKHHNWRKIVFLTKECDCERLVKLVYGSMPISEDGSIYRNSRNTIYLNDIAGLYENTWVICVGDKLTLRTLSKTYSFNLRSLDEAPYMLSLKGGPLYTIKAAVYSEMKTKRQFILNIDNITSLNNFTNDAIRRFVVGRKIISLYDIFLK
ncbi:TVG0369160 [Thermoplasma volcanium GSS1]|uniref:TVG0369160 protein n=1 Tax=Thermoplasma volcanium (strain ATCC 51530 / DSM 4299 / JCM 9571 / NBRC 15438 / GSS1) TaxID=273116 RepID=Q97BS2_THEVO|nr:type IV secretion system DNA-binding domain-containing protein [Thermoplasma volcanium]BAB59525.1 TVG0369160 [Thermoplasma volcanium GSS1]